MGTWASVVVEALVASSMVEERLALVVVICMGSVVAAQAALYGLNVEGTQSLWHTPLSTYSLEEASVASISCSRWYPLALPIVTA